MKNLVIVESPAKAKTIKNFLGKDYEVIASKGHIRDLPQKKFGIKIQDQHFTPEYVISSDHKEIVAKIKELAKKAKTIYIATDEDREGEAIGFHITQAIGGDISSFPRIVFHEITKSAIMHAISSPRNIDMDKVDAQQARRLLDRIVGFKLSGLIANKIQKGLSAGRVQSSTLKLVVDREKEIQAFKPVQYFSIQGDFDPNLSTELISFQGQKLEKLSLQNKEQVQEMLDVLQKDSFSVQEISKKTKKTPTPPPFMTSTLQQSASTLLGFSPTKTMSIAQKLYEGVQTHQGVMGVITYMRTDSLNIAKEAQEKAREVLLQTYGEKFLPTKPKNYTSKNKSAQEAHEAIRPTDLSFTPQIAKEFLAQDELKLYTLIYNRFLASQSVEAEFESQSILISSKNGIFKASGSRLVFEGFYKITGSDDKDKLLPALKEGENLTTQKIFSKEHFTEPPARFNEASLIKTMESLGIGRPSTYAPTISLLNNRDYIKIEKKQIFAQENAFKVTEMLSKHFEEIVDSHFTAKLEEELDEIAEKKQNWQEVLWRFYDPFIQKITEGKTTIASQKVLIPTGEQCPECGSELVKRSGRYGEFVSCSGYPKCKYIKPKETQSQTEDLGKCEKCGLPMVKKVGRNGEFIACSGYPNCKNTKSLQATTPPKVLEVKCPECGGDITQKRSRMGAFFGCSNYPKCNFISKFEPVTSPKCPECGYMVATRTYRGKEVLECIKCKHRF
ncbi:type I DNA topoisomerase [Helicobacter kayseriensis]|uniref:type I DNA topoisomerase n=1 Tax=Helicobacter kayseriensis TaxID=2905877 RepID=UPI001E6457E7|nr:type I DNA topoisomerase [Helicobacter kayseriensis]MCE3047751.1 type I DNA topoisomerase [Helicobacter kayseriensis]MCE3049098.1 type I DNA topoisomerase [Helicobacter kayseriensis]